MDGSPSISASGSEEVPSSSMGKSDGNSSNRVSRTALSCSGACKIKVIKLRKKEAYHKEIIKVLGQKKITKFKHAK